MAGNFTGFALQGTRRKSLTAIAPTLGEELGEVTVQFKVRDSLAAVVVFAASESSEALWFGLEFPKPSRHLGTPGRTAKLAGCTSQFGRRD